MKMKVQETLTAKYYTKQVSVFFCQLGNPQTYAEKADGFFFKKLTATKYAKSSAKKSHGSFAKDNKIDAKS